MHDLKHETQNMNRDVTKGRTAKHFVARVHPLAKAFLGVTGIFRSIIMTLTVVDPPSVPGT